MRFIKEITKLENELYRIELDAKYLMYNGQIRLCKKKGIPKMRFNDQEVANIIEFLRMATDISYESLSRNIFGYRNLHDHQPLHIHNILENGVCILADDEEGILKPGLGQAAYMDIDDKVTSFHKICTPSSSILYVHYTNEDHHFGEDPDENENSLVLLLNPNNMIEEQIELIEQKMFELKMEGE